jgi:hypothetical protein
MKVHAVIPDTQTVEAEDCQVKVSLGKVIETLSQKQDNNKRTGTWLT